MISEIFLMKGYGIFVWSAFAFTIASFSLLYTVIRIQYLKEKNKFVAKFGNLDSEQAAFAKSQSINKEILSNTQNI
tara:strand:+ start:356 stop:583 length:228 start_codon:yes stop_codon:yes gene_type:complete